MLKHAIKYFSYIKFMQQVRCVNSSITCPYLRPNDGTFHKLFLRSCIFLNKCSSNQQTGSSGYLSQASCLATMRSVRAAMSFETRLLEHQEEDTILTASFCTMFHAAKTIRSIRPTKKKTIRCMTNGLDGQQDMQCILFLFFFFF